MTRSRARGVLVLKAVGDEELTHEYRNGDEWSFSERQDGVWLHVVGLAGESVATFRPGTYDRVESAR